MIRGFGSNSGQGKWCICRGLFFLLNTLFTAGPAKTVSHIKYAPNNTSEWLLTWLCLNVHETQVELPSTGSPICVTWENGLCFVPPSLGVVLEHWASHPVLFSWWVTTAISYTKNTLKETAPTDICTGLSLLRLFLSCFLHRPLPLLPMSWEKSGDNTVHAPKSSKSVSAKSLLIRVRPAKAERMGENKNESEWNKNASRK